jgi:hypothetical protein
MQTKIRISLKRWKIQLKKKRDRLNQAIPFLSFEINSSGSMLQKNRWQ